MTNSNATRQIARAAGTVMFAAAHKRPTARNVSARQAAEKAPGDAEKGAAIFKENCSVCHYADKTERRVGPGLKGLFKTKKLVNGKPVTDANVRSLIENGTGKMMAFKERLDKTQLDDLLAYLHTL